MTLPNNKVKLVVQEVDYKPFISLFNVTNATVTNPEISRSGKESVIVHLHCAHMKPLADYASAVALELSKNTAGEYSVALKFKNGTNDNEFQSLKMFDQDSLTFPQLVSAVPNDRWP
jgi:prostatic aicd phosphatase